MADYRWSMAVTVQADGPPTEGVQAFVQWKGTDVCLDFRCDCGFDGHLDGYFAYTLQCPACGAVWEMPATIVPRRVTPGDGSFQRDRHAVPDDGGDEPLKPVTEG